MLEENTPKGRLIATAMRLAGERPWQHVTLVEIAEGAGVTLNEVRKEFADRPAILRAFVRAIDDELLAKAKRPQPGDAARDALFEVVMARLDLLAPYRRAIRSIADSGEADLAMLAAALASQRWMLAAAGIDGAGPRGAMRTLGLASVYASVLRTWLDDDDPGLARTMAALDRRLRRGERSLQTIDSLVGAVEGFGRRLGDVFRTARRDGNAERRADAAPAASAKESGKDSVNDSG